MLLMTLALKARQAQPELFAAGEYLPLESRGKHAERVVAFGRRQGEQMAIVVAPRLTVGLVGLGGPPPLGAVWEDTRVVLPKELCGARYVNTITSEPADPVAGELKLASLLRSFPAALSLSVGPEGG
jgi:(1->4)-alpha-D-glucan 1-alpha-D-glucosylmutase